MAHVANADDDGLLGGARLDHVAAGATDFRVHIFRMNVRLHKKDGKTIMVLPDDKREFLERMKEICRLMMSFICLNCSTFYDGFPRTI
jgi:hypothetical protein